MSDLDDVMRGVFVIRGDVEADQDALTVQVPHLRQRPQEAPVLRRPLILGAEPVPNDGPPKLGLFERFQNGFGVQLLQYSCNTQTDSKKVRR